MRPRLAFQLADLVSTWSRWLRLVYHLGPATNSYRFPVKKQPVMKTAKEWNNLAVAMNECLWKHGRWRRLESRSRKDTISLHLNAGNNEGGYTPVSLLVSKPHPTAGYRPTGKRKSKSRRRMCLWWARDTDRLIAQWFGSISNPIAQWQRLHCLSRNRFPLSQTPIKKHLGFITVNRVNELQVREGEKQFASLMCHQRPKKRENIDAPDCPQFASEKKPTIRSRRKHNTHYQIFDAAIHKQTLLRGKQPSAI